MPDSADERRLGESRATEGPHDFLGAFSGRVVCDAYVVYSKLAALRSGHPPLDVVGCWTHVRRCFREARLSSHPADIVTKWLHSEYTRASKP